MKKTEGMRWSSLEATEETVCKPFPTKSMCNTDLYTFRLWSLTLVTLPLPSINVLHIEGTCNSVAFVTAQKVGFLSASLMELLSLGHWSHSKNSLKYSHIFFFFHWFFSTSMTDFAKKKGLVVYIVCIVLYHEHNTKYIPGSRTSLPALFTSSWDCSWFFFIMTMTF